MAEFHPLRDLHDKTSASWSTLNIEAEKKAKAADCASMPSLDHLCIKDFENVYEPSDDTVRPIIYFSFVFQLDDGLCNI